MTDPRMRTAAIAGSMALSMSLAAAPVALAQDGPEAAIQGFADAVVAKDFEAIPGFFCEAQADQAAQFDVSALASDLPPGLDVSALMDAFAFDVDIDSTEVVSESTDEAVVHVVADMALELDQEALMPFVETFVEMSGMEVDDATVGMFMAIVASEFERAGSIDADITLVPGDDGWLICSDLAFISDELLDDMSDQSMDDTSDDDASDDSMGDTPDDE